MAARVARLHSLVVWNRTAERTRGFAVEHSVRVAGTPAEAVAQAEVVLTCLPTSKEVEVVLDGPTGMEAGLRPCRLFLDCTSGDPATFRRFAAWLVLTSVVMLVV